MIYDIVHRTEYRFNKPVGFGQHRLLFRPRDGHDMRVLATDLQVEPGAQRIDLLHDVYGNSIAHVLPSGDADHLVITTLFTVDHLGSGSFGMPTAAESSWMPPAYGNAEMLALQPFLLPSYPDPGHVLRAWAQPFANAGLGAPANGQVHSQIQGQDQGFPANQAAAGPRETIAAMTQAIRHSFEYRARDEEGVQAPQQTLQLRSGSCRDFATLMIDALRHLGIAARFVSGYLYVPPLPGSSTNVGGGATHAWVQCYLPDCGWFPADPTNNLIGGHDLIRVAVGREAAEVVPLAGAWYGETSAFAGLSVNVSVTLRP